MRKMTPARKRSPRLAWKIASGEALKRFSPVHGGIGSADSGAKTVEIRREK